MKIEFSQKTVIRMLATSAAGMIATIVMILAIPVGIYFSKHVTFPAAHFPELFIRAFGLSLVAGLGLLGLFIIPLVFILLGQLCYRPKAKPAMSDLLTENVWVVQVDFGGDIFNTRDVPWKWSTNNISAIKMVWQCSLKLQGHYKGRIVGAYLERSGYDDMRFTRIATIPLSGSLKKIKDYSIPLICDSMYKEFAPGFFYDGERIFYDFTLELKPEMQSEDYRIFFDRLDDICRKVETDQLALN